MKWFFALNEYGNEFENYSKMLKVAVHTAQKFTSLEPHFLYDGQENDLTRWLRNRNATIVNCRSFLYEKLRELAEIKNNPHIFTIGTGAFLRTEIPRLALENGFQDEFVLYTDLDVMFLTDIAGELEKFAPKYFSVAPEISISDYRSMNSGVMLMNVKNLQAKDVEFRKFMVRKIETLIADAWDQTAYKLFYNSRFFGFKWDKLPPEFNWKPYWGDYSNARIIHFHGPKPFQKEQLLQEVPPEAFKSLMPLLEGKYFELMDVWEKFYAETA
jgi:lipopolysaccharide biosynthesis glycosyltransferase